MELLVTKLKQLKQMLNNPQLLDTTSKTANLMKQLNNELDTSLGMINYIYTLTKNQYGMLSSNDEFNKRLRRVTTTIDKIIADKYTQTSSGFYLKNNTNMTWKILSDIFSIFLSKQEEITKISQSTEKYPEVINTVSDNIHSVLLLLNEFENIVIQLITKCNNKITNIKKSVHDLYTIEDIVYAQNINPNEFLTEYTLSDKINEIITGYDGIISDPIIKLLDDTFSNLHISDFENMYTQPLINIQSKIGNITSKTYGQSQQSAQTGGDSAEHQLYEFNIKLPKVQKQLYTLMFKLKEYQNVNERFTNYFVYQVQCITSELNIPSQTPAHVYQYINKKVIEHYNSITTRIINNFNNYNHLYDENEKEITKYFNLEHYFTIKRMDKFFRFILNTISDNIIDIGKCKNDTFQSFAMFNQFKSILDDYYTKIENKTK